MAPHTINMSAAYRQLHKHIIQQCYFYFYFTTYDTVHGEAVWTRRTIFI